MTSTVLSHHYLLVLFRLPPRHQTLMPPKDERHQGGPLALCVGLAFECAWFGHRNCVTNVRLYKESMRPPEGITTFDKDPRLLPILLLAWKIPCDLEVKSTSSKITEICGRRNQDSEILQVKSTKQIKHAITKDHRGPMTGPQRILSSRPESHPNRATDSKLQIYTGQLRLRRLRPRCRRERYTTTPHKRFG